MNGNGMGTTPEYAWTVVVLSAFGLGLALFHGWRAQRSYRVWHDERSALALVKGIGLVVISFGLLVSSSGLVVDMAVLSVAGLSITRGAFIALMLTLVLVDIRPGNSHTEERR